MSDRPSEKRDLSVSPQVEAAGILQEIVGPIAPGAAAVKAAIRRASTLTGLSYGRTRSLWYGAARVWAEEMDLLRAKATKAREARKYETNMRAADIEADLNELRQRFDDLAQRISSAGDVKRSDLRNPQIENAYGPGGTIGPQGAI